MTDQLPYNGKFPPLSEIGGLYVITQKKTYFTVWRTDDSGKKQYRRIKGDKNKPFLFLGCEVSTNVFGYVLGTPVRIYKFLLDDGYVWEHKVGAVVDTLSTWIKPISVLSRYNPAMKKPARNLGTKYPGPQNPNNFNNLDKSV